MIDERLSIAVDALREIISLLEPLQSLDDDDPANAPYNAANRALKRIAEHAPPEA